MAGVLYRLRMPILMNLLCFIDGNKKLWFKAADLENILQKVIRKKISQSKKKSLKRLSNHLGQPNGTKCRSNVVFINQDGLEGLEIGEVSDKLKQLLQRPCDINSFELFRTAHQNRIELPRFGFIYVTTTPNYVDKSLYKIGQTGKTTEDRLIKLNTGNNEKFYKIFDFKTPYYKQLEKHLHNVFNGKRKEREFFELDYRDIDKLSEICNNYVNKLVWNPHERT